MTREGDAGNGDAGAPRVSVVIPAFDAAGCIGRAIRSVQAQTLQDFEIVVADDRSGDDTVAVVERLAAGDRRIRVLKASSNGGPSAARNRGLAAAKGVWIAGLDADDAFLPERLESLVDTAETLDLDMIADDIAYYDLDAGTETGRGGAAKGDQLLRVDLDRFLRASLFRQPLSDLSGRNVLQHALLKFMVRRSFVLASGVSYPEQFRDSEDFHFYAQCLVKGARMAIAPAATYLYSQRYGSLSRRRSSQTRTIVDRRQIVAGVDDFLKRHGASLSPQQVRLLRQRQAQAKGLHTLEKALALVHKRRIASALWSTATTPTSWGFVYQALVQRARRPRGVQAMR